MVEIARSEFILGGQKSGKSRRAEMIAKQWLDATVAHRAVLIATGQAWDDEMRERIARHQRDRMVRVPGMVTVEEPLALAEVLQRHSAPHTLVVVDCLTLWLTNLLMPAQGAPLDAELPIRELCRAIEQVKGPVVLVGLGGIWIEALKDVRLIPADMAVEDIVVELGRLKAAVVLQGVRGAAAVDLHAIAQVVAQVGAQMRANPAITEIDINPLVAYPAGSAQPVLALDALVVVTAA
jgi:adenosylcobinamide kinase/adenosylcobinamide-phosphate guanylyltransferase